MVDVGLDNGAFSQLDLFEPIEKAFEWSSQQLL